MNTLYYAFALLIFLAVVLLLEGLYFFWRTSKSPESKRLQRRLQTLSAGAHSGGENVSIVKQRLLSESPLLERLLMSVPRVHHIDRMLQRSGLSWSVAQLAGMMIGCALAGFLACRWLGLPVVLAAAAAAACGVLPFLQVLRATKKRIVKIDEQLPEALDLLGRALKAGHAFPVGLKMIGDEMPEPIAGEFRIVSDEVTYGIAMSDALMNLCTRVPSTDLRYFVIAVLIQRETGGNLVEILDNISSIIRARLKLLGTIRVLSAEGRLSVWILSILPFAVALVINVVNPGFMDILWTDPMGLKFVIGAGIAMAFGIFWMRQIIKIRV